MAGDYAIWSMCIKFKTYQRLKIFECVLFRHQDKFLAASCHDIFIIPFNQSMKN